jgi:hypothetical protein
MDNDRRVIDRITVPEAAERLGITQSAVHKRISREQMRWEKDDDGRVYVFLDSSESVNDKATDRVNDRSKDELVDSLRDQITAYKDQVDYLRAELARRSEEHREEMRRKDHLLAATLERIPAIEAPAEEPSEPRESPVTTFEDEGKGEIPRETEKRTWWQRMFGG